MRSRAIADAAMTERNGTIHARIRATYGMPRVRAEPIDQGTKISRKRVPRPVRTARVG